MRVQRSIMTFSGGMLVTVVGLLLGLVTTPLILEYVGAEKFGAFRVLSDWIAYLAILEFGLVGSLSALFVKALGNDDQRQVILILRIGLKYYSRVLLIVLGVAAVYFFFLDKMVPVAAEHQQDLVSAFIIMIAAVMLLPWQLVRTYVDAQQRGYITHFAVVIQSLGSVLLMLLFTSLGYGITGQALGTFIGLLLAVIFIVFQSKIPWKEVFQFSSSEEQSKEIKKSFWNLQWPSFTANVCGRICLLTDNIVISALLGPKHVVPFFLTQKLTTMAQAQLQNVGNATWAGMGDLYTKESSEIFGQKLVELTKLVSALAGAVLLPIFLFNEYFISLWTGADTFVSQRFTAIVALNAFWLPIYSVWGWCFYIASLPRVIVPMMVVQAVVNISLNIWLTMKLGVEGPVLATLITYFSVPLVWLPLLLKKHFDVSVARLIGSVLPTLLISVGTGYVVTQFIPLNWANSWLMLGVGGVGVGLIYSILLFFVIFKREERERHFSRLKALLQRTRRSSAG